jgi:AcrR family transcriptional regulator
MARTINPVAHAVRREAFLDAAQRLVQTKGYERLSIGDVLADVSASKGAFYHYFDSKAALLHGLVERMVDTATAQLAPALADPDRSAQDKFGALFSGLARFKAERKEFILSLLQVWLSDENAIVRERMRRRSIASLTPLVTKIIEQGVAEGVFTVAAPDTAARVFMTLVMGANETATELLAGPEAATTTYEQVERTLVAYGAAFEQVLGACPGTFRLPESLAVLREWFDETRSAIHGGAA